MWRVLDAWQPWFLLFGAVIIAVCAALVAHYVLVGILRRVAQRTASQVTDLLLQHLYRPVRWIMVAAAVGLVIEPVTIPAGPTALMMHVFAIILIVLIAWLLIRIAFVLSDVILLSFPPSGPDSVRTRTVQTQIHVVRRIVVVTIITVALASLLMTFPRVRQLGAALLASAGIAGIVVGLAAQRTLGSVFAGLQIALTQPLRINDTVIVEGEWGNIEEITLTYVVIRIWDLRRLIVPITYFVERPFQNWTRATTDILGTVMFYMDYTVPVAAVRAELQRILENTKLWDRKVGLLQVTSVSERTVELRALVSAPDAGTAFDLRCHAREKLIEFLQEHYPQALPKLRAELPRELSVTGSRAGGSPVS